MAIHRIQKKEYDRIVRARKMRGFKTQGECLIFKAANRWYYKQEQVDMAGLKEVVEFKKTIETQMKEQTSLI